MLISGGAVSNGNLDMAKAYDCSTSWSGNAKLPQNHGQNYKQIAAKGTRCRNMKGR